MDENKQENTEDEGSERHDEEKDDKEENIQQEISEDSPDTEEENNSETVILKEKITELKQVIEDQESIIDEIKTENEKLKKSVKRQQDIIDEKKRRNERNKKNLERDITKDFVKEIGVIRESLNKAVENAEEGCRINSGVESTIEKIDKMLEDKKVKLIDPKIGNKFNPELHEAVATMDSDQHEENKILEVQRSGFLYDGNVLRYAKVIISE